MVHGKITALLQVIMIAVLACAVALLACGCAAGGAATERPSASSAEEVASQAAVPAGFEKIGGTWEVGGIYVEGSLVDVNDSAALKDMYDSHALTFNEDGMFAYLMVKFNYRGNWSADAGGLGEGAYLLQADTFFRYGMENGEISVKGETATDKAFLATLLDDDTLSLVGYDAATGGAVAGDNPVLYVRRGGQSAYIEKNKVPLSSGDGSQASSAAGSAPSSATSSSGAAEDDDFELVGSGYDDANGKGYKGSDGNYYFVNNDGSFEATDGKGNGVKDVDGDGEADYYTNDSGKTWHEIP